MRHKAPPPSHRPILPTDLEQLRKTVDSDLVCAIFTIQDILAKPSGRSER